MRDQTALADAREAQQPERIARFEVRLQQDRIDLDKAQTELSDTEIHAPISGILGLRLIDRGNIVRAADPHGIFIINQLQPISVLFKVPESQLQRFLARLDEATPLVTEAWDRTMTKKLAAGRVTGMDNQINQEDGTVKVRAVFDNQDGALYPNQYINIRVAFNTR